MSTTRSALIPPPPLVYLAFIGSAWGLERLLPLPLPAPLAVRAAGWAVILLGLALMVWAALEMYRHRTTINPYGQPRRLLQRGPFRYSRNPIYLADALVYCGIGLLLGSLWPWLLLPLLILCMQRTVIVHEERLLTQLFGDEYQGYRQQVRRWL
ncbi:isoprenylcysteine carboxylmethyltransferase family protein [Pseudomonas sp.]|uniref:methyltransferase family protein n=1 Tax=Pseudomonas sp. TaxID=306 RepID=UPI0028B1CD5B|nr:isoprenylcysteine carboxylmethyltransferase family protein [Pseudomonas sp.]